MSRFRRGVMRALDDVYDETGGDTPDHIIVSEEIYAGMRGEQLKEREPLTGEGFMGMTLWHSAALDRRDNVALLLSDEVFQEIFGWDGVEPIEAKDL